MGAMQRGARFIGYMFRAALLVVCLSAPAYLLVANFWASRPYRGRGSEQWNASVAPGSERPPADSAKKGGPARAVGRRRPDGSGASP